MESGSDDVLKAVNKGVSAQQMLEAGTRLRESGIDLWVMILLGLAGTGEAGLAHARASAQMMNEMRPRHLSLLSLIVSPDTPLGRDCRAGRFLPATPHETLLEIREIISNLTVDPLHFTCDHASNYLPLKGSLPEEKEEFLAALDDALRGRRALRPEWYRAH